MADNLSITPGTGAIAAADEASYSGDTTKVQVIRQVHVDGSEGSKTVKELVRLEDAAHTSGDPGVPALGVRADTAASLAGTDGDYTMPIFDASGRQHVNVGASALPTGAATSAKQDTVIGHLDGVETSLTAIDGHVDGIETLIGTTNTTLGTIDTDTGNISTKIDTVAGAVSGTEMQVDVVSSALPSGAATSAKQDTQITAEQAIQTSVELIDDTVKAEDAAFSNGDKGIPAMTVRQNTAAALSGTDADYQPLITDGSGRLHVNVGNTVTVDGSGVTQPISHSALTELAAAINADAVDVNIVGGSSSGTQYTDADTDSTPTGTVAMGTDGSEVYAVATDTDGHLQVDVLSGGGGGTQYTEGDTDASITGTAMMLEGAGNALVAAPGTSSDGLLVNLGSNNDVTVTGTVTAELSATDNAVLDDIAADTESIKTAVEIIDNAISGSEMQVDVVGALPAGNNNIGDVDIASIAAGDNNIGNVDIVTLPGDVEADIDQIRDQIDAQNTGSSTMNASSSDGATALTNSAQVIKASAGRLLGYYIYNPNATAQFVQFYNTAAASVTVGTTNPLFMLAIPATSAANLWMGEDGPNFSNAGWSWAATSTAGGNGAPGTAMDAVAFYK